MNNELYLEIKKIINDGCNDDYYKLYDCKTKTLEVQRKLCSIYFKSLPTISKFDYISEISESYRNILFSKIESALISKGVNAMYLSQAVGIVFLDGLVDRLNETMCDIFNEHYEQYMVNENNKLLPLTSYKLNENDVNWVNDYKNRKKDLEA